MVKQEEDELQTSRSRALYARPQEHFFFLKIYCKESKYSIFDDKLQNSSPKQFE